jgi:thiol:disulfide interchange protein DsbD
MGMVFLTLATYLVPGMWGAPVKLISGFPPPMFYSEWSQGSARGSDGHSSGHVEARYTDYEEGLAAAIAENKPLALDFTGWACVNCRKNGGASLARRRSCRHAYERCRARFALCR